MKLISAITRRLVIIIPYAWLLIFFLVPFGIVLKISLSEPMMAMPPYAPTFDYGRRDFGHCLTASSS